MKENIIKWIQDWFNMNGPEAPAVIGISGGVDSTVVAALCVEALGKERVYGVLLPCGEQTDLNDAYSVIKHLDIPHIEINIEETYQNILAGYDETLFSAASSYLTSQGKEASIDNYLLAAGNTQSRVRMTYLYAISQMMGGRVSNNCNKSEQFIGYSTRWGDDAGDFAPLRDLTKREVVALAHELGVPKHLANKVPIDGLDNNLNEDGTYGTDEDAMGFTYKELDDYILNGTSKSKEVDVLIEKKHKLSDFKRNPIAQYKKGEC